MFMSEQENKMNIKKRIFNFICFFVILPISLVSTTGAIIGISVEVYFNKLSIVYMLSTLLIVIISWTWLIVAYMYLIKIFDDKETK